MNEHGVIDPLHEENVPRVDWTKVDHVLLDMDGTLLDLAFDNDFWGHQIHAHYAALHNVSYDNVVAKFEPIFRSVEGSLNWYSTDHWTQQYGFDIIALSQSFKDEIRWLDHAQQFLLGLRDGGIKTTILTNAHPDIVELKHSVVGIRDYVGDVISSHEIGYAKEHPLFWEDALAMTGISKNEISDNRVLFFDDSVPVLNAAISAGIHYSVMICAPDSTRPKKMSSTRYAINSFDDIWPQKSSDRPD